MSWLAEIVAHKREEIKPWLAHTGDWGNRAAEQRGFRGFRKTLEAQSFGFIGEVKRASPSAGIIAPDFDPVRTASAYDQAGADCISVLTDEKFFLGHLDYLALIRTRISRPLLRKDFTLHEVQIYQAALAGADAVLLIVAALSDQDLKHLIAVSEKLGIDYLVEIHDSTELDRALQAGASFIGINNRNLATFELDLAVTEKLAPLTPETCTVVSESGIRSTEDVQRVASAGVDAVLVGEALMRAADPARLLKEFADAAKTVLR